MSTTTTINPANSGNSSDGKKKAAAFAATAASAAGLGVAGSHIVSEFGETEDPLAEENVIIDDVAEEVAQPNNEATGATTTSTPTSATTANSSSSANTTSATVESQPITSGDVVEPNVSVEPTVEPASEVGTEVAVETEPVEATNTTANEVVNPDEIAEAIIAENKIDPNDIDMADVINFDEIGTVYTVDGESYTAAAFHDAAGNNLIMVDVDGDNVFDVITDYDGNLIAEVPGNLSVGDAQEDVADDDVYLAYDNEMDNVDEYGDDSLADDLMA